MFVQHFFCWFFEKNARKGVDIIPGTGIFASSVGTTLGPFLRGPWGPPPFRKTAPRAVFRRKTELFGLSPFICGEIYWLRTPFFPVFPVFPDFPEKSGFFGPPHIYLWGNLLDPGVNFSGFFRIFGKIGFFPIFRDFHGFPCFSWFFVFLHDFRVFRVGKITMPL